MAYISYSNDLADYLAKNLKKHDQMRKQMDINIKQQSRVNPTPPPQSLKDSLVNFDRELNRLEEQLELLKNAIKFRMPYGADLFAVADGDDVKTFADRMCGGVLKLPYKQIVIEYEDIIGFVVGLYEDFGTYIAFSIKNAQHDHSGRKFSKEEANYILDKQTGEVKLIDEYQLLSESASAQLTQCGVSYGARPLLQLLAALNCSNVSIEDDLDNLPSTFKQAMRRSGGGLPLFTFKVLTINTNVLANGEVLPCDGDIHTKRSHLRRGHIRKYKSGQQIWINAMAVGLKSNGVVEKSYSIK